MAGGQCDVPRRARRILATLCEAFRPSRRLSLSGGRLSRYPASKVSSKGQDQRADTQSEEHDAQKECE